MPTSTSIVLRKKANKSGQFPLMIRITKERKTSYISTGYYIDLKHWDAKNRKVKKSYPNSTQLNNLLLKKLSEINSKLMTLESRDENVTLNKIRDTIKKPVNDNTFNSLSEKYIEELVVNEKF